MVMTCKSGIVEKKIASENLLVELNNLTRSIEALMRSMREMETPIEESRNQLPKASQQLDKISTQTEAAAHHMLQKVEQIIKHQDEIGRWSDDFIRVFEKSKSKKKDDYIKTAERIGSAAVTSKNDAFLIMDTLQFQDITSQQVEHVSELLKDVEHRLHHLQEIISGSGVTPESPPAEYDSVDDRGRSLIEGRDQKEVDVIFSRMVEKGV
jgi:chemotaxis regulatin CheY-phosphate phosphatase CheZ